jgi:hypothetical protein
MTPAPANTGKDYRAAFPYDFRRGRFAFQLKHIKPRSVRREPLTFLLSPRRHRRKARELMKVQFVDILLGQFFFRRER